MEARLGQSLAEDLAHRPGEVRDESDLLRPDPESVGKLVTILGERAPAGVTGATPEEVALLVHTLREEDGRLIDQKERPAARRKRQPGRAAAGRGIVR